MLGEKLGGRYKVAEELGRGGMGVVYRASDPLLSRQVAVKLIAPDMLTPEIEERFQGEARIVAQMDHPAIVPIYDFGRHEGALFFVMPVVEGQSLRDHLRMGSMTLGNVIDIGIGVAEALDYSHKHAVVHRDIKPENIMVSIEQGEVRLRIMDFGLARGGTVSAMTKTGVLMGTVAYISPEQVRGGTIDGRTDLYALGSVLYECLVHEVPFTGDMQSILYRVVHEVPQSPRSLGCDVDIELEEAVLRCLAKSPEDRPATAGELAQALRQYRAGIRDSQRMMTVTMAATVTMPRPALSPFVGREDELKELQQRLNAALRGECQLVMVAGDAGAGKTRLLEELEELAQARQIRVLHGRFVEQDGAFPYHGFCEAIQEFFRHRERGTGSSAPPDLSDLADDLVALFPMLAEIPAVRDAAGGDSGQIESGQRSAENRTEIYELLARTLTRLSAGKPLVLLLEDLHGADASIDALQYIARRLGPTSTLLIGTLRTSDVDRTHPVHQMIDSFRGDRRFVQIDLGPLPPEDHREFLSTLTGGSEVAPALAEKLYEITEGNPFFTKELVRSMIDAGSMAQDDTGSWSLSGSSTISSEALPATIQQAVEARIDRLPDELRQVLSIASVMGRSFEFGDLESLAGDEVDLEDAVDRFIQEGLLEEDRQSRGDRLNFSSAVVREVLYGELGRRKRRRLHQQYALRLEKRQSGRLERVYPALLYHFYEGDVAEKTVEYGLAHARQSMESFNPEEAVRAARVALEFLDEDWEGAPLVEAEARMLLAAGHQMAGDIGSALREIDAAVAVYERQSEVGGAIDAMLLAANAAWRVRQTEETSRWVERGIAATREAKAPEKLAQFLSLAATLANLRGDYARGTTLLREAEGLGAEQPAVAESREIPEGGTLVVGLANRVTEATPIDMQLTEDFEVLSNAFETLLVIDDRGNLSQGLCASWEAEEGGQVFRFALRPDVEFHDGALLDAAALKDAFERAVLGAKSAPPPGFSVVEGIDEFRRGEAEELAGLVVSAEDTLEIRLSEELPIYPALLSDPRTAVFRREGDALVGTGPFKLGGRGEDVVTLPRNPEYHGGVPRLESLDFRMGLSPAALSEGFRSGELDLTRDLLPQDLETILRDPRFQNSLVEAPQKFTYFVVCNTRSGVLADNPAVRRALAGTVRARDLVWQTLGRFAVPATGLIPPGILGHDPGRRPHVTSPDEARDALAAAGGGVLSLRAAVHPLIVGRYGALFEGLVNAWRDIGIEVEVATDDLDSYLAAWKDPGDLDLLIMRWQPDFDDPDSCTHILFHSRDGQLRNWYSSEEADELLDRARREARPGQREILYRRFENLLFESGTLAPVFNDIGYRLASSKLRGVRLGAVAPYVNYAVLGKSESAAGPAALAAVGGGVIRVPISVRVDQLEPAATVYAEEAEVGSNVYETLVRDVGGARIGPWLAASWTVEESGARYRFRLRDDVRFHDGRRLTARDVRASLERLLMAEKSDARNLYSPVRGAGALIAGSSDHLEGFKIHSALDFSIELETPVSFFPVLLASPYAAILPEGTPPVGKIGREHYVGTGPFRVRSFEPGRAAELERNPTYWRRGYPRCDTLVFNYVSDPSEILEGFRAGRFSIGADLYPEAAETLKQDAEFGGGYHETPKLSSHFLALNMNRGPFVDRDLRQRVAAALDVPGLVQGALGRNALVANGLIPPGLIGHDAHEALRSVAPFGAKVSLDVRVALTPVYAGEYSRVRDAVARALARCGIRVEFTEPTAQAYTECLRSGNADMMLGRWVADYPDADTFAFTLNRAAGNVGRFCGTEEVDALITAGRTEVEPEARHLIYRQIERKITSEVLLVPLFYEQAYRFARPELRGMKMSFWMPSVAYEDLSLGG